MFDNLKTCLKEIKTYYSNMLNKIEKFIQVTNNSKLSNKNSHLSWNFEELDGCGWNWVNSSIPDSLRFENTLEIIGNPHQISYSGVTIDIGTQVDPITLSCDYSNTLTLDSNFMANHTTYGQNGAQTGATDFTSAFIIELLEFNTTNNDTYVSDGVMVGEELLVIFTRIENLSEFM